MKFNFISKYIFISVGTLFLKHWDNKMNDNKGAGNICISFVGEMVNLGIIFSEHRKGMGSQGTSVIPYPTAFPYGNGMVLHFYQQQESSTTKTVHKVINKGLKTYV